MSCPDCTLSAVSCGNGHDCDADGVYCCNDHRRAPRRTIRQDIKAGVRPQGAELTEADVRRSFDYQDGFGLVQTGDVGKRVWLRGYGISMENNEQRDTRKKG